jgi:hypothetical protein
MTMRALDKTTAIAAIQASSAPSKELEKCGLAAGV